MDVIVLSGRKRRFIPDNTSFYPVVFVPLPNPIETIVVICRLFGFCLSELRTIDFIVWIMSPTTIVQMMCFFNIIQTTFSNRL